MTMSKESTKHGLGVRHHGAQERESSKRAEPLVRGRFVPDAQDIARLRPSLAGNARR